MASRAHSDLMLVGSFPSESAEEAMRLAAPLFGDCCFGLPDGETGERAMWITHEAYRLFRPHPDLETLSRPRRALPIPGVPDWVPGNIHDFWQFRVKPGSVLRFERWPRVEDALESYQIFTKLRGEGVVPEGVRFQVGLPFPSSAISMWFRTEFERDYPIVAAAYEDLVGRELRRLFEAIPADDLAIQWDVCIEVLDLEGVFQWTTKDQAWGRYAAPIPRLSSAIPDEALLGYHFCYGTFPQWPMYEARDMALLVRMANEASVHTGRSVDFIHMAGPRTTRSDDDSFFEPLRDLDVGDTRVFLGLAMPIDGEDGLRIRTETARRHLADFGIANYCGFARQPGVSAETTMRDHRALVDVFRAASA